MTAPLFQLTDLVMTYGSRTVLDIPSLEFQKSGIYCLLGHNGSGKTTLLKILAFLESPTQGSLRYKDVLITPRNMALGRGEVVWSPQFPIMFSGTVRYNVEFPLKLKGLPTNQRRARAEELLALVELSHLAGAYAPNLSGGEAQRLSLARALATGAEVLLLDEPTANIDAQSRQTFLTIVDNLAQNLNLTIIIATHDHLVEERLGARRLRLVDGRLIAIESGVVYEAELKDINSQIFLSIPGSNETLASPFRVLSIVEERGNVLITLINPDKQRIAIRPLPEYLPLAIKLSLSDEIHIL
jgi:ABC-type multidrug transport system ATPase subunit